MQPSALRLARPDKLNASPNGDMPVPDQNTEDLLEKGFQLAYFLYPDRTIAVQVLRNAMSKLSAQRSREEKRAYWRDKYMKRKITRVVRNDGDMLQWLIYCESAHYEKQQELMGQQTERDMVVRYIKHLVQVTTAMSSFYVSVGLQRLLRNYSTSEAQRTYECLADHYPGAEEYRRIKGVLMKGLEARFPALLKTGRSNHGELRFETYDTQEDWADLVDDCLRVFSPWSTTPVCSRVANLSTSKNPISMQLFGHPRHTAHSDVIEAYRSHMFIDPGCYHWLAERLRLDPPWKRLAVPRFYLSVRNGDKDRPGGSHVTTSRLRQQERREILDQLAEEALQRKQITTTSLAVMADGREFARIDLDGQNAQRCEIPEGIQFLELWTQDQDKRVLLATHWIEYTQWNGIADTAAVVALGNGKELLLELVPEQTAEAAGGASMLLTCRPVSQPATWQEPLGGLRWFFKPIRFAVAVVCLVTIAGVLSTVKYHRQAVREQVAAENLGKLLAREQSARAALEQRLTKTQDLSSSVAYRLIPEDLSIRGGEGVKEAVVSVTSSTTLVVLELPVRGHAPSYQATLKSFFDDHEVLSESILHPAPKNGSTVVAFPVPSALLEDRQHYAVTVEPTKSSGHYDTARIFTFHVVKK
jgi:hypothetical protein